MPHKIQLIDCAEWLPTLASESVDLVILDPPYFRVVTEEWDRKWRTEQDYQRWASAWINEVARVTRLGGTVYLFGYAHTLLQLAPMFTGFNLRQIITVTKGLRAISGRNTANYKMFPVTTEAIAFLVKDPRPFVQKVLLDKQKELGLSAKEINSRLGVKTNGGGMWSLYTGENILGQVPTKELWDKLTEVLGIDTPYGLWSQTFHLQKGLTDVWDDIDFYAESRIHPTQKPVTLIRRLLETSSNPGDTVLDPFGGSGSTLIACEHLQRNCLISEQDPDMYNLLKARYEKECWQRKALSMCLDE